MNFSYFDYVVVGAGFTGSTFARIKAESGSKVLVVDSRHHVGGNAYDYHNSDTDVLVHKFGPHIFHTNSKDVWEFVNRFSKWISYNHKVVTEVKGHIVSVPLNFKGIRTLYGDRAESLIEKLKKSFPDNYRATLSLLKNHKDKELQEFYLFVFNHFFKDYTQKMWGISLESLGPTVADRVPVIMGNDDHYFKDEFQAMPERGYSPFFQKMLDHPNIYVKLNQDITRDSLKDYQGKVLFTGPIDKFFDYKCGHLPYRSLEFLYQRAEEGELSAPATFNFNDSHTRFTRFTSMRKLTQQVLSTDDDIILYEIPREYNPEVPEHEPYYPIPLIQNRDIYHRYQSLAEDTPNLRFAGRMGSYQYLNMDQAIAQAMKISREF